ncbi:hypothetical protein K7432_008606 [Basidiobolus ranarum]|uniref:Uncharacterized protein n=1 Tax=Basidiobolus ranarum TaxID=34480 RepID=A0ABR2WRN7_9FUNG
MFKSEKDSVIVPESKSDLYPKSPIPAWDILPPELRYDPGSVEYEVTANFMRYSIPDPLPKSSLPHTLIRGSMNQPTIKLQPPSICYSEEIEIRSDPYPIPTGSILFLMGFLVFPCWWVGAIYPYDPSNRLEMKWRLYNRMISIISLFILGFSLGAISWYVKKLPP